NGVLKIEPTIFSNSLVFISSDNSINDVYDSLAEMISNGEKDKAIDHSTKFIMQKLNIPTGLIRDAKDIYFELRQARLKK
ncbi:MAG: hypothetical protein KJ799_17885, partial [Bacteroidetes bacterium]|nr:hypothetical protein [Bacteroidota bacterium]